MPTLEPFRGVRYDRSVPLDQVIAPPYDVIDQTQRDELAGRHPDNSVLVELPQSEQAGQDAYDHAAELLAVWQRRGILRIDPEPSLYVYRMQTPDGWATTGVLGAVRLPNEGSDDVRPHEQTLAKPLGDRLHLLRAARANLSPIWVLSVGSGLSTHLVMDAPPTAEATDDDGVLHQLWRVDSPQRIEAIAKAVATSPLVVADGHHRYQTALHFRDEDSGAGRTGATGAGRTGDGDGSGGAASILGYVVELAPDQLRVGAIHRLLTGVAEGGSVLETAKEHFDVVRAGSPTEAVARALEESRSLGLVTPDGVWLLSERPGASDTAEEDVLDSQLIAPLLEDLPGVEVSFAHGVAEAVEAVVAGRAQAALLLRPVTVELIARWAQEQRLMPPKTTYFYPKPRTGMVFRLLDT